MPNWDQYWMQLAADYAGMSMDRSTKIGAVIVNEDNVQVSSGFNKFPPNVPHDERLHERPTKYIWTIHAEVAAIANAAATGKRAMGCKLYTTMSSCSRCAPVIAQAGIIEVISYGLNDIRNYHSTNPETQQKWLEESKLALEIFNASQVSVRFL